jgi:hypothetical protein
MARVRFKNKDKAILCGVIALEIYMIVSGANNLYWFITGNSPFNLLWTILSGVTFIFCMFYLVTVLAIYRDKQRVMKSFQKLASH